MRFTRLAAGIAAMGLLANLSLAQRGSNSYIVVLDDLPLASAVESRKELTRSSSVDRVAWLKSRQSSTTLEIEKAGGRVFDSSQVLVNALFVEAGREQIERIKSTPGVRSVQRMLPLKRRLNKALDLSNVPAAWNQIGGAANAGAGVKIAILDTGIDQNHPAFKNFAATLRL